jgi:hypothetical protein
LINFKRSTELFPQGRPSYVSSYDANSKLFDSFPTRARA